MRFARTLAPLAILLAASPAAAEPLDLPDLRDRIGKILSDLTDEVQPALQEMIESFGFLEEIDSFEHYGPPEVLPNGDIIIRRSEDAPAYIPPEAPPKSPAEPAKPKPGVET